MNQLLKKKGDITIFLIVAVIALFLFFFLFVLFQNQSDVEVIKKNSLELSTYGQKVKMYVEQCLYDSAVPAVYYVGLTGGYIDPPPETFRSTKATIAYYYYFDADKMPSKGKVQNEISKYIEETLFICIRNFQGFPGVDIDSGVMHADTLIGENDVTIHLEYPVTIKQGSSSMTVEDFQTLIPIRLGKNYGYAKEVNEELLLYDGLVDITLFDSFDVESVIMPYDDKRTIYLFRDTNIDLEPSMYFFAAVKK